MKTEHKRLVELAGGWEGSKGTVFLSPADAREAEALGVKVTGGGVSAADLCAAARLLTDAPEPVAAPAPVTVAPTVPPAPPEPVEDGLEELTVAELRELAAAESVTVGSESRKAQIVAAIREARAAKAA